MFLNSRTAMMKVSRFYHPQTWPCSPDTPRLNWISSSSHADSSSMGEGKWKVRCGRQQSYMHHVSKFFPRCTIFQIINYDCDDTFAGIYKVYLIQPIWEPTLGFYPCVPWMSWYVVLSPSGRMVLMHHHLHHSNASLDPTSRVSCYQETRQTLEPTHRGWVQLWALPTLWRPCWTCQRFSANQQWTLRIEYRWLIGVGGDQWSNSGLVSTQNMKVLMGP